jgi:hypothetical protein
MNAKRIKRPAAAERNGNKSDTEPTVRYGGIVQMSATDWANVQPSPRQRDTEARARKAWWLRTPDPVHANVNAARLPDGTMYKIDGHTRGFMWGHDQVPAPVVVYVTVWDCKTIEDAKDLYSKFDSQDAVETAPDKVYGAMREHRLEFKSELLASARFSSGLGIAQRFLEGSFDRHGLHALLFDWAPQLKLLDQCNPTHRQFVAPILAGFLLLFRRYGEEVLEFCSAYQTGAGTKFDREMDAVQALDEYIARIRGKKAFWGEAMRGEIVRAVISAYEAYRIGRNYSTAGGVKPINNQSFQKWITEVKNGQR